MRFYGRFSFSTRAILFTKPNQTKPISYVNCNVKLKAIFVCRHIFFFLFKSFYFYYYSSSKEMKRNISVFYTLSFSMASICFFFFEQFHNYFFIYHVNFVAVRLKTKIFRLTSVDPCVQK